MKNRVQKYFYLWLILLFLFALSCGGGGSSKKSSSIDTTLPIVTLTSPANNTMNVSVSTTIIATFSEAMDASTINTTTFTVGGVTGNITYSGTTATFTPSNAFAYNTQYTATITIGVKDVAGNNLISNYTWNFTTGTEIIIPTTTKILYESTMQNLSTVSQDGNMLTFNQSTPSIQLIVTGDVIVSGITDQFPYGTMRKVTAVTQNGNQVVIETTPAALEEAIQTGSINLDTTLSFENVASTVALRKGVSLKKIKLDQAIEGLYLELKDVVLYDDDGDMETTGDQIIINGIISLNTRFELNADIDNFQLKQFLFKNINTETVELQLTALTNNANIEKEVTIAKYVSKKPYIIWVNYLPIIITPEFEVTIGLNGEVSIGISASAKQEATAEAGFSYSDGMWSPINTFKNEFQFNTPSISVGASFNAYASQKLTLLIDGIIGPYGKINEYLELEADVFKTPWWQLYGGFKANVGIDDIEVLSHHIMAGYNKTVIDKRWLLDEAYVENEDITPPEVISITPINNATNVSANSGITATFSESMDVSTINTTTFTVGGVTGTITYSGMTATFTPSSPKTSVIFKN